MAKGGLKRRGLSVWLGVLALIAALGCNTLLPTPTAQPIATPRVLTPTRLPPTAAPVVSPEPTVNEALALDPANLSAGDPYAPELGNRGYDVQRYILRVALRPGVTMVEATAQIELQSTQADLRQVSMDFIGFELDAVLVDSSPADYARLDRKLLVQLPAPLADGQPATVAVAYHGTPVQEPSVYVPFLPHLGLQFETDHIYVVSEPDGARYWFPANDHPRDKAAFRFEIVAPPGLTGVANGELVETQPGVEDAYAGGEPGDLYVWEQNHPMATYAATVAVGPFERVDDTSPGGVRLRSYVFEQDRARFEPYRAAVGELVDWMSAQLGPYPFEAFGYVLVGGLGGALETQTMVVTDRDSLSESILAHELAHQWFGDWVSLDSWGEMWRSEGAATYFAALWAERDDPAELAEVLAERIERGRQSAFPLRNPPAASLFSGPIYDEGALLVAELRQVMGDDAFYAGLRAYFERYGGGTASDADFQAVMEEAAGQPLEAVFSEWLE